MWDAIGITGLQAVEVVVSAVGIYVVFLGLIRLVGQRSLASMSSFDFAAVIALGAVSGRAILGYTPTMAAGFVGLAVLFGLQGLMGQLRRSRRFDALISNQPLLLMAGNHVLPDNLARAHIIEDELRSRLRLAGVRSPQEVAAVVLERTGAVSVIRRGGPIDPDLLGDVRGKEALDADIAPTAPWNS